MQKVLRRNRNSYLNHDGLAIFDLSGTTDIAQFTPEEIAEAEPTEDGKFVVLDGRTPFLLTKRNLDAAKRHLAAHPGD